MGESKRINMKRLVLEVSPLFGELAIEKVNNMYRLTQEDDMLYFTPSEIIHLTQIEYPYTDKIVSINDEHKIHFYSSCPGFNIKSESMCLSVIHWDSFIDKIKYFYYSNERKHSLKWLKNCNAIITNACNQNDETVLNVSKCYEDGDVLTIRQIDDFRSYIVIPTFFVSFFGCTILVGLTIICAEIIQKWLIFGSLWTLIPSAFILAILLVLLIIGSFVIPAQLREKYKDYKWKKDYALHVENIDRAYKGLPPIQPKKSIIVEFLKARKAKVCPVRI